MKTVKVTAQLFNRKAARDSDVVSERVSQRDQLTMDLCART